MVDLELTRTPGDRDRYSLEGVGTLQLEGVFSSRATAEAAGNRWHIARRGFWRQLQATDAAGVVVGTFDWRLRGGGILCLHGRELALRRASVWRERYSLADGDRAIALLDTKRWGRRPVTNHGRRRHRPRLRAAALRRVRRPHARRDGSAGGAVAATTAATTASG